MIDMSQQEKVLFLEAMSYRMKVDPDVVLSMYLTVGDDLFLMFSLLENHTVKFPSLRTVKSEMKKIPQGDLFELKAKKFRLESGRWICVTEMKQGMVFIHQNYLIECKSNPKEILSHKYVIVKKLRRLE